MVYELDFHVSARVGTWNATLTIYFIFCNVIRVVISLWRCTLRPSPPRFVTNTFTIDTISIRKGAGFVCYAGTSATHYWLKRSFVCLAHISLLMCFNKFLCWEILRTTTRRVFFVVWVLIHADIVRLIMSRENITKALGNGTVTGSITTVKTSGVRTVIARGRKSPLRRHCGIQNKVHGFMWYRPIGDCQILLNSKMSQ